MKKVNSIYNRLNNKKKAFTLIELLIVIAIIGILFIVLVSKVDFATDKAKATGVQTTFRSFQMAFDTVAKENAGFNTFGFDTGDNGGVAAGSSITINGKAYTYTNADKDKGDGIRNSYDEGDINLDGKNVGETWTGRKVYTEKWNGVWTLVKPGTSGYDSNAIFALESAINKNLDPKLHITIDADGKITMANQARDPWKNEYHGYYITNAETDNGDRGAIVIYSNGANGKWGSAHDITNGVVTVSVPGNNVDGKDDYSLTSVYTFTHGYGEVLNLTTGFSNNMSYLAGGNIGPTIDNETDDEIENETPVVMVEAGLYESGTNYTKRLYSWDEMVENRWISSWLPVVIYETDKITGDLVLPEGTTSISMNTFTDCTGLTGIKIPTGVTSIGSHSFKGCTSLQEIDLPSSITKIENRTFSGCTSLHTVKLPETVKTIGDWAFNECQALNNIDISNVTSIGQGAFYMTSSITNLVFSNELQFVGQYGFSYSGINSIDWTGCSNLSFGSDTLYNCDNLLSVKLPSHIETIPSNFCARSNALEYIELSSNLKSIGNSAFEECNLTSIALPDGLESIGVGAFGYCSNLSELLLPDGVTTIGANFIGGTKITELVLPSSLIIAEQNVLGSSNVEVVTIHNTLQQMKGIAVSYKTTTIIFIGTMQEWLDIEKANNWCESLLLTRSVVQCLDGRLLFNGTVIE